MKFSGRVCAMCCAAHIWCSPHLWSRRNPQVYDPTVVLTQRRVDSVTGMVVTPGMFITHCAQYCCQSLIFNGCCNAGNKHLNHLVMPHVPDAACSFLPVDIHMDNTGVWCEGVQFAGHRSSKRAPTAISKSHSCTAKSPLWCHAFPACPGSTDNLLQCAQPFQRAGGRHFCGSEKFSKAGTACAIPTPPPTYSIGFSLLPASGALAQLRHVGKSLRFNGGEPRFQVTAG